MKKDNDCEVFHDQLDALQQGDLSEEGLEQLRRHAGTCSECAMSLRVHEHLAVSTLADLEAAVPHGLTESVWRGVKAELADRRGSPSGEGRGGGRATWLVPAMAAAILALAVATGVSFTELTRVQARERVLARTLAEQQTWLAELDERTSANANVLASGLAGRGWARALSRRERITLAELSELLRRLPARTTVLTAAQAETLMGVAPLWAASGLEGAIGEAEIGDGVRADELLEMLERLNVDPDMTLRTSRIIGLLRG